MKEESFRHMADGDVIFTDAEILANPLYSDVMDCINTIHEDMDRPDEFPEDGSAWEGTSTARYGGDADIGEILRFEWTPEKLKNLTGLDSCANWYLADRANWLLYRVWRGLRLFALIDPSQIHRRFYSVPDSPYRTIRRYMETQPRWNEFMASALERLAAFHSGKHDEDDFGESLASRLEKLGRELEANGIGEERQLHDFPVYKHFIEEENRRHKPLVI